MQKNRIGVTDKVQKKQDVQDSLLERLKKHQAPVNIFLINGIKLLGTIVDYDTYVIILDFKGQEQMVFKHSISTVIAEKTT
jgi:host factor-I protein